MKFRP
jgi:hypothetical protein